jgi:beta-glucanase (GH16 family)
LGALLTPLVGCTAVPEQDVGEDWEPPSNDWHLAWSDEFEGANGAAPDASKWAFFVRGCNYNDEMQFYTDRRENTFLDGAGNLVISANREDFFDDTHGVTLPFTSGRLETLGSMEQRYGAFEARVNLPTGKGLWPAFWLLGNDYQTIGWPQSGEVDILELAGSKPDHVSSALHVPGTCGGGGTELCAKEGLTKFSPPLPNAATYPDDFHVYRFEWTETGMRWLIDGVSYHERTRAGLEAMGMPWKFDHPFFMILNIAVGGKFDGNPDASTVFPQQMLVDYVRVYTLPGMSTPTAGLPQSTDSRPDFPNLNCEGTNAAGGAAGAAGAGGTDTAGTDTGGAGGAGAGGTAGANAAGASGAAVGGAGTSP